MLGIISWIVGTIANGVCVKCASDLIEKGKASLGESFNFTLTKLLSLLVAALITGILIALGFLALIVPGIILYIMFYLVVPTIIIEDIGAFDSLSRSRRLVSNRWLKTFVLSLIVVIITGFVAFIGSLIGASLGIYGWFFKQHCRRVCSTNSSNITNSVLLFHVGEGRTDDSSTAASTILEA